MPSQKYKMSTSENIFCDPTYFDNNMHFSSEFFQDVCSEIEKLGTIVRFFTCCNREAHLRGNVYIQMDSERDALRACRNLAGRWFGGKRLQPYFVDIANWKNAICGNLS